MTALPPPGSVVAGKYRVESLIGEGGMGAVFRAHHELMDRPVALKCLHPELSARSDAKERFVREARAAARIRHPNVVEVQDVGEHDGALFMVMELLEGDSFAELIREERLPVRRALHILIDAMEGVCAAHDRGIVHRDIKPENIFVVRGPLGGKSGSEPQDIVKILDFGVSKLSDGLGGSGSVTLSGQAVGTPEYMAPEQMLGEPGVDARADVYSFGVLLYRVLTGENPFRGDNFAAIAVQVATLTPVSPRELRPEIPIALERVVERAMARDRDERYPNLRALIDALRPIATGDALSLLMPLATHVAARGSSIARDVVSRTGRRAMAVLWIPVVLALPLAMLARWSRSESTASEAAKVPAPPVASAPAANTPAENTVDAPGPLAAPGPAQSPTQVTPPPTAPIEVPEAPAALEPPPSMVFELEPEPEPEPVRRKPREAAAVEPGARAEPGLDANKRPAEGEGETEAEAVARRRAARAAAAAARGEVPADTSKTAPVVASKPPSANVATKPPAAPATPKPSEPPPELAPSAAPAPANSATGLRSGSLNRTDF